MSTLADARTLVADLLVGVAGLEVYRYIPGSVNPPAAVVWPDSGTDPVTVDAESDARMVVRLLVQFGETEDAQDQLDDLLDEVAAVLAGEVGQIDWDNYGVSDWGGSTFLSVDLRFGVHV